MALKRQGIHGDRVKTTKRWLILYLLLIALPSCSKSTGPTEAATTSSSAESERTEELIAYGKVPAFELTNQNNE